MSASDTKITTVGTSDGVFAADTFLHPEGSQAAATQTGFAPPVGPPPALPPSQGGIAGSSGDEGPQGGSGAVTIVPDIADDPRPRRNVALVGYTTSREETPYRDPAWERWGMNNLHKHKDIGAQIDTFTRWYDLHVTDPDDLDADDNTPLGDRAHLAWLREEHPFPIYLMDPFEGVVQDADGEPLLSLAERTGFPSAVPFPKLQILSQFMRYFTNTVSWQIAHAIFDALHDDTTVFSKLGLFGIDMATGTEYAAQRPSVEYFLGLAQGLGVQLLIPPSSDLLKAAELYGGEDENSGMRAKVSTRLRELHEQKEHIEQQLMQGQSILASVCGAIDSFAYIQGVWVPPIAGKDGRDKVLVPAGSVSPVAQMIAEGEKRDRETKKE